MRFGNRSLPKCHFALLPKGMKLYYDFMLRGREIIFLPPDVKRDTAVYSTGAKLINQ